MPQSIIFTGPTGSGKTKDSRSCIHYLLAFAESPLGPLEKLATRATLLLDAFGCCVSPDSQNSSYYASCLKMSFGPDGKGLAAVQIDVPSFAVTSLAHPVMGQRNMHIFYQTAQVASEEKQTEWGMHPGESHAWSVESTI